MVLNIEGTRSFIEANKSGYKDSDPGIWSTTKGVIGANWDYASHHKLKTAAVIGGEFLAIALTTAYFMSPAYAVGIGAAGAKAAARISPAITGLATLAVANPLLSGLIMIAALGTIVTLAHKNYSKSSQIDQVKQKIADAYEKGPDGELNKFGSDKVISVLESISDILKFTPDKARGKGS